MRIEIENSGFIWISDTSEIALLFRIKDEREPAVGLSNDWNDAEKVLVVFSTSQLESEILLIEFSPTVLIFLNEKGIEEPIRVNNINVLPYFNFNDLFVAMDLSFAELAWNINCFFLQIVLV